MQQTCCGQCHSLCQRQACSRQGIQAHAVRKAERCLHRDREKKREKERTRLEPHRPMSLGDVPLRSSSASMAVAARDTTSSRSPQNARVSCPRPAVYLPEQPSTASRSDCCTCGRAQMLQVRWQKLPQTHGSAAEPGLR
jgi:hypothetical protein